MTGFLLDTNCLSELIRLRPDPNVLAWMRTHEQVLHVSVLTLGEIRKGVTLLPAGRKRVELEQWLETKLPTQFSDRLLTIDAEIAEIWGAMAGEAQIKGVAMAIVDGLIAATAKRHNLHLVTRNVRDFRMWDIPITNPWELV